MIYLYTMPGVAFNAPQFNVSLIKGYLKENNIETKQIDLSITFFENCINSFYIKKELNDYYLTLSSKDRKIVDEIDVDIDNLKNPQFDTDIILNSNEKLLAYLNIYSKYYDVGWNRKGLNFNTKILTIDELLKFAFDENNKIFDLIFTPCTSSINDICYLSLQFPFQLPYALRFARKIKKFSPHSKIIFGGDYITHIIKNAEELMDKCSDIDGIVFFGEHKYLLELINYFRNKNNINIPNTYIRKEKTIIKNEITNCNILDKEKYIPCFDDLNLDKYLSNLKLIPLTLNYGCYHSKCKFCSRYFYYNGYKKYDIEKIFSLIKEQYEKNNIQAIYFIDECVPSEMLIKLANYLLDNNINIKWLVETRIDDKLLDSRVAKVLYDSGCREISFGIESYNNKILDDMNKQIDLKMAKKVMKNFFNNGISVSATFMIGYPTESIFNIIRTLKFIKKFKYIDTFGLGTFNYMRNSILVNQSNLDESSDLNLIYRKNGDSYEVYNYLINKFNSLHKIKKFSIIRDKVLYRSQYLYLDRKKYSLNYKKDGGKVCG